VTDTRLPVLVVSGFLGSGKTTLLREALHDPRWQRSLVIVNEAAELGIDDQLLRPAAGTPVRLLQNGCLCCAVQSDLKRTLLETVDDPALTPRVDRIVIETSGLADPVSVIASLSAHPRLSGRLRLQAVVTTVDALHAEVQLDESPEFTAQVQCADMLILTKQDVAVAEQVERVARLLRSMNPMAAIVGRNDGIVDELLHASSRFTTERFASQWLASTVADPVGDGYVRLSPLAGVHGRNRHTRGVVAFAVTAKRRVDWVLFSTWLSLLVHAHGQRLLRIKGLLEVADDEPPIVVNVVRHVVHFPEHLAEPPFDRCGSCLVFLVRDLEPADIRRSLSAFVGECFTTTCQSSAMTLDAAGH